MKMGQLTTKEIRKLIEQGRSDEVPWEDLRDYQENMEHRENFGLRQVKNLYKSIALQGIVDYKKLVKKKVVRGKLPEGDAQLEEFDRFFESEFFKNVSGVENKEQVYRAIRNVPMSYVDSIDKAMKK